MWRMWEEFRTSRFGRVCVDYARVLGVWLAMLVLLAISFFGDLFETRILGYLGPHVLEAIGAAERFCSFPISAVRVVIGGMMLFSVQFAAAKQRERLRECFWQTLLFGLIAQAAAAVWMHWQWCEGGCSCVSTALALAPTVAVYALLALLISMRRLVLPALAVLVGRVVHVIVQWWLCSGSPAWLMDIVLSLFGIGGIPAVAALIQAAASLAVLLIVIRMRPWQYELLEGLWKPVLSWRLLRRTLPVIACCAVVVCGSMGQYDLIDRLYGEAGMNLLIARSVIGSIEGIFSLIWQAAIPTAMVVIGHSLGEGDQREARRNFGRMCIVTLVMALLSVLLQAVYGLQLYPIRDAEVMALAERARMVLMLLTVPQALGALLLTALNAGGRIPLRLGVAAVNAALVWRLRDMAVSTIGMELLIRNAYLLLLIPIGLFLYGAFGNAWLCTLADPENEIPA